MSYIWRPRVHSLAVLLFLAFLVWIRLLLQQQPMKTSFTAAAVLPIEPPSAPANMTKAVAAQWAVRGEENKMGAGILIFAYGAEMRTLQLFLKEATSAAGQIRSTNPKLNIAIVCNNASVDRNVFTHHIMPREDLLFQGSRCPYGESGDCLKKKPPTRQWMTRLYYLAHSPFKLTWALDSNIFSCSTDDSITRFLESALRAKMWGFDIAHANQGRGPTLVPHNWNIMVMWNERSSNLLRDWLLLQLRRGIATDDQNTLYVAETRARKLGGITIGQMPTPFAACFYSTQIGAFYPRITRPLKGTAHIIHAKLYQGRSWCHQFNTDLKARQLAMLRDPKEIKKGSPGQVVAITRLDQCEKALNVSECPYIDDALLDSQGSGEYLLKHPQNQVHTTVHDSGDVPYSW